MTRVLDMTAGSRMMWFNQEDPRTTFMDCRCEQHTLCDGRTLTIRPDIIADFRALPFRNEAFDHIVFDPPHLHRLGKTSWTRAKYGVLFPSWKEDLAEGFNEAFRVLKHGGTLIFKWNETQIPTSDVISLAGRKPLYGHKSGKQSRTHWIAFIKEQEE